MGSFMVCKKVHYYCKDLFSLLLLYFWDIISCSPRGFMEYKISQNKQKKRNQNLKVGKKTSNGLGMTSYSCWDKTNSPSCQKKYRQGLEDSAHIFEQQGCLNEYKISWEVYKFLRKQKFINQLRSAKSSLRCVGKKLQSFLWNKKLKFLYYTIKVMH